MENQCIKPQWYRTQCKEVVGANNIFKLTPCNVCFNKHFLLGHQCTKYKTWHKQVVHTTQGYIA